MYLLSLILGFTAWGIGLFGILRRKRVGTFTWPLCALSLYFQLRQVNLLVRKEDYAAIEDTFPAILFAAGVLLAVNAILSVITRFREGK